MFFLRRVLVPGLVCLSLTAWSDDVPPGRYELEYRDDFSGPDQPGREVNVGRGAWSFENQTATAICDQQLYAQHRNHGPILKWPAEFRSGTIEFEIKAVDCQRVVFTLNGDGHVFRVTLADETDACPAGPSKVPTRLIAWTTKSSKQNKGDTIKPNGLPDLPSLDEQWVRVQLAFSEDQGTLTIGRFKTELKHPALGRPKTNVTLTFAHGTLSVRNYRMNLR